MRLTKNLIIAGCFLGSALAIAVAVPFLASGEQGVTTTAAGPNEVIIIRHAEEPDSGPHLSDQGRARAKALVNYFQNPLSQPTSLFAAKSSNESERPVETLEPLAKALNIRIDLRFDEQEYKKLAQAILQGARHAGGYVVVCWKRETMSQLAAALGVASPPAEWPAKQYDRVWRIHYSRGKATLTEEGQGIGLAGFEQ